LIDITFTARPQKELQNMKKALQFTAVSVLLACCAASMDVAATATVGTPKPASAEIAARPVRTIEGVSEYRLPNGLQVLLDPDASSSTVTVNLTYKVGSRHESYGETGMAHLLEHMNFKGTPRHRNIPAELSSHGASANATTAYDRTNYFETLPSSPENLQWALGLEADRMTHSFIAKKDLDSEMTVVRNEFESGENDPARILEERVLEAAYLWHNYGHPTIGARADIENVPIQRLQAFYHTYYQPDNATLIVTGKFDPETTLALIERTYGAIPKPSRSLPSLYTAEPTQDGEREVVLRRAGTQPLVIEAYHVPSDAHADSVALGVLAALLNEKPAGLLYKRLIETKLATSAAADVATLHDPGFLTIDVTLPKDGDAGAVRRELGALIESLRGHAIPKEEIERIRNQQFNEYERLLNSPETMANTLSENVSVGDWRLLFWDRDQLNKVTLEDVRWVANTYLIGSNRTTGTFIPEEHPLRAVITPAPAIDTLLAGYIGNAALAEGEQFVATPAAIEDRVKRGTAGTIKTVYLPKKTRGDRISSALMLQFGSAEALKNKAQVGSFTAALLMRGTQSHTRLEIQDELTRLKATMVVNGGANGVTLDFETTQDNLAQTVALAAEILRSPAFPPDDLDELKRSALSDIDGARKDPNAIARLATQRYLSPYEPTDFRYVATVDERAAAINKVTAQDIRDFYQQFYGANSAQAAFVGNVDPTAITAQLTQLLGSWQSASPFQRAPSIYKPTPAQSETFRTPDKANAVFMASRNLPLRDDDPDFASLRVGNEILGGGFLNSRFATRIRQKDGLSYTVGSSVRADSWDAVGAFTVYAICAPQNLAQVERDAQEEIARALADGFTPAEIAAAKSGIGQSELRDRSTDAALAYDLAMHLYLNRDFQWDARADSRIEAATPDSIKVAMQRFIDPSQLITVKAGDVR
jgi:zinc protease